VWAVSAATGYWVHVGIPALNSILLAFLLYTAAGKLGLTETQPGHRGSRPGLAAKDQA
jgi:cytosine permease